MWHTDKYGLKISCISWVSFATAAFVDFNKPYVEIISLLTITHKNLKGNILVTLNWVINFSLRLKFPSQCWLWTFVSYKLSHLKVNCCHLSIHSGKVWTHFGDKGNKEEWKRHNITTFQQCLYEDSFVNDSSLFQHASSNAIKTLHV